MALAGAGVPVTGEEGNVIACPFEAGGVRDCSGEILLMSAGPGKITAKADTAPKARLMVKNTPAVKTL